MFDVEQWPRLAPAPLWRGRTLGGLFSEASDVLVYGGPELLKDWFHFREVSGGHSLRAELPYAIFQATKHKTVVES
jgi:hypothetical protein